MISTVTTVHALRSAILPWREAGETVAFVPTMGALHRGHIALIAEAKLKVKRVVASIFVNPKQFGEGEDLAQYPRQLEKDQKMLEDAGCDLLYAPEIKEIYPDDFATTIDPGPLAKLWEGAVRPDHFRGVATVVVKLLLQLLPDAAFFGEKDYQQLIIIQRVVRDLNIPIHILGVPTVRDTDGLALSSRNIYLGPEERRRAVALPRTLQHLATVLPASKDIKGTLNQGKSLLLDAGFTVDYLELVNASTLSTLRELKVPARLLAAARMGKTRLIDNVAVVKA